MIDLKRVFYGGLWIASRASAAQINPVAFKASFDSPVFAIPNPTTTDDSLWVLEKGGRLKNSSSSAGVLLDVSAPSKKLCAKNEMSTRIW